MLVKQDRRPGPADRGSHDALRQSLAPNGHSADPNIRPEVHPRVSEGKEDGGRVGPYAVFEMGALSKSDKSSLSILGRLKAWAHGDRQAFVVRPDACQACQLCVDACPGNALKLVANRS